MPKLAPILPAPASVVAYNDYVRQAVQAALDDPRPSIPHEEAKLYFAHKRAILLQRPTPNQEPPAKLATDLPSRKC
ncbi:hypothetical protein [Chromobacterium sp. IIBBL 290-4]|uniref:antitoxin PaaA2 family protein n=1 Tax=Chromobacterium sp. IIBBL 290-4 TaxID=2953890 RepID=UPI00353240CF